MYNPLNPIETPFLYHYTSVKFIRDIIKRDKDTFSLKASPLNCLSDKSEYYCGDEIGEKTIEHNNLQVCFPKDPEIKEKHFSISLSSDGNSKYLWENYGDDGKGIVLKFNSKLLLNNHGLIYYIKYFSDEDKIDFVKNTNLKDNTIKGENSNFIVPVQDSLDNLAACLVLLPLRFNCKNKVGFEGDKFCEYYKEKEVRMLYPCYWISDERINKKDEKIKFALIDFPSDILEEVIVGPNNNDSTCISDIKTLLRENNFHHVNVSKSNCKL